MTSSLWTTYFDCIASLKLSFQIGAQGSTAGFGLSFPCTRNGSLTQHSVSSLDRWSKWGHDSRARKALVLVCRIAPSRMDQALEPRKVCNKQCNQYINGLHTILFEQWGESNVARASHDLPWVNLEPGKP